MEPDYFIYQYLQIQHTNGVSYIQLKCIEKNYCKCISNVNNDFDKDYDSDYDTVSNETNNIIKHKIQHLHNKIKFLLLRPRLPIIIYENNHFISQHFKNKYEKLITKKINEKEQPFIFIEYRDTGKLEFFDSIIRITKIECRYDPWLDADY